MSKVSIIRSDNIVVVDGVGETVDCSTLDPTIRAVLWAGDRGHIEFFNEMPKKGEVISNYKLNELIDSDDIVKAYVTAWQEAHKARLEREAEIKREMEAKRGD